MWKLLTVEEVIAIHDTIILPHELQGLAGSKSLDGALSRIDFRITYGAITDVYDLAATYAVVIARGHVFNDANKRTAYMTMHTCLVGNDVMLEFSNVEVGDIIVKVAQGHMDEIELAAWLRKKKLAEGK
jgi:death on curing protein